MESNFTLEIKDGRVPEGTINGQRIAVITLIYNFATATEKYFGANVAIVTGYMHVDSEPKPRIFSLDFRTGYATEI